MEPIPHQIEVEPRPIVNMLAVQARMLLVDQSFLDPNETEAPVLKSDTIHTLAQRNYLLFEEASLRERKAQQNNGNSSFDEKYQTWSSSVKKCFNADANKQKMASLKTILKLTEETVTDADIKKLYDRYFDSANSLKLGVKAFVQDVVMSCENEGRYDASAIEQKRQSIKWVAQLFGSTSSEMIDQLISAEIKLLSDPVHSLEVLNEKRNDITEPQKKMMTFISNKEIIDDTTPSPDEEGGFEEREAEIKEALLDPNLDNIIITATTGAGKSRKVPRYIKEILIQGLAGEKVAVTSPRRLPTEEITKIIALDMDTKVGKKVGWRHGKGSNVSEESEIISTVEGSLLRKLAVDPTLPEFNYVMIDEWHERHQDTDILVGALVRAQKLRKKAGMPPLKIIITSATMDGDDLKNQLGESKTKLIEVEYKKWDIDEQFEEEGSPPMDVKKAPARAAKATAEMLKDRSSDRNILIFMPGDHQIKDTYEALTEMHLDPNKITIDILTGSMTREEQESAINVSDGKRHIIIATPVAETSLTIKRIDVISSGYLNIKRVDENTGLEYLETKKHLKKGLIQQRGRTGRESDGVWKLLMTRDEYNHLEDYHLPEILRTDLTDKTLLLKKMELSIDDPELPLIDKDKIPQKNKDRAVRRLKDVGAFDADGEITQIGKQMVDIPLDYHYSRMLVEAQKMRCMKDAATIAVACSQTDLDERLEDEDERDKQAETWRTFQAKGSDFISRLHMFNAFEEVGKNEQPAQREALRKTWAAAHYLRYSTLQRIEEERAELLKRLKYKEGTDKPLDENALSRCVFEGFRDNLLVKNPTQQKDKKVTYYLDGETTVVNAVIDIKSATSDTVKYVVTAGNYPRQKAGGEYVFMRMNQVVDRAWLSLAV